MKAARLLLADDHALVRASMRKLLELLPAIELVGEADDGLALLDLAARLRPDLVLMDIAMPRLDGLAATTRLRELLPATRVVILSMHQNQEYVRQALALGAAGYLLKDAAPLELEAALEAVLGGGTYLSLGVRQMPAPLPQLCLRAQEQSAADLTPRQRTLLRLLVQGLDSAGIAQRLSLASGTVEAHRQQLRRLLQLDDAGLLRWASEQGLDGPEH